MKQETTPFQIDTFEELTDPQRYHNPKVFNTVINALKDQEFKITPHTIYKPFVIKNIGFHRETEQEIVAYFKYVYNPNPIITPMTQHLLVGVIVNEEMQRVLLEATEVDYIVHSRQIATLSNIGSVIAVSITDRDI